MKLAAIIIGLIVTGIEAAIIKYVRIWNIQVSETGKNVFKTLLGNRVPIKKVNETAAQRLYRYPHVGEYLSQKYFGSQLGTAYLGVEHAIPLTNYMNAQVQKERECVRAYPGKTETR